MNLSRLARALGFGPPRPRLPSHLLLGVAPGFELGAAAVTPAPPPAPPASTGIALVPVIGPVSKYPAVLRALGAPPNAPTSLQLADAVRSAASDPQTAAILLYVDSPGGTIAGTLELAQAVAFARSQKPTHAYVADMAGSAAYWVAAQADRLSVNATGHVGSIGTYALLVDDSAVFAAAGLKVRLISSGGIKGVGAPGVPVSDELVASIAQNIDDVNAQFLAEVARGRAMPLDQVKALADGRLHVGQRAVDLGLVDAVETFGAAVAALRKAAGMASGFVAEPAADGEAREVARAPQVDADVERLLAVAGAPAQVAADLAAFAGALSPEQRTAVADLLLDAATAAGVQHPRYEETKRLAANVATIARIAKA